jgi:hypothetical protein
MTREQGNNIDPFAPSIEAWQSLMTYWLYTYAVFVKNTLKAMKMTEDWYYVFYKPKQQNRY